jgi:aspartate aminotransferase/aminotransferase
MPQSWIAQRTSLFDSSGIRKVFELAATMKDPINFSIGQPDFDVPQEARLAAIEAIQSRKNGYAVTQGVPLLRERLQSRVAAEYAHPERKLIVTSGTSGGLMLAMMALIDPGDEVIMFDPYFVMYAPVVKLIGGVPVVIDTYPDFRLDPDRVRSAITGRTKLILLNSPANPTGIVATEAEIRGIALVAADRNVALLSDEIYREFCYDGQFHSPATFNPQSIVIDGFSKSHAMTGWRLGFAHGPAAVIDEMAKLQQYTFVCAPQPFQWAAAAVLDVDMSPQIADYRRKRDMLVAGLAGHYELERPSGAFYAFPKAPGGTATDFVARAVKEQLLVVPGGVFSRRDTHFRISYATDDATLQRGIEALRRLAVK